MAEQTKSFVNAAVTFFGRKPGQSIADISAELKALTPEDRAELAPLLSKELGVEVVV